MSAVFQRDAATITCSQVVYARAGSGGTQGVGQEGNVLVLVLSDLQETTADPWFVAGVLECLGVELVEALLVEGALELLQH